MTPAVKRLKKAKVAFTLHSFDHDPDAGAFGREAAEKLKVPMERLFKTLVVDLGKNGLASAMVPVSGQLDLKALAKMMGVKKAAMADKDLVERTTGYVRGGVSPLGQKKQLPIVIDASAARLETLFFSAGKRGLQVEMPPSDFMGLTGAASGDIARPS